LVWRVLDDGTVDRSYGTAGLYRLSSSYRNDVTVVAALSDGSILVGVNQYDMSGTSSAARIDRLTPAGARDDAFGAGGEGINVGVQFAFGVDERTGRIYVVDTNGSDLIFHVFWL
jgi:hypothetical protein